MRFLMCPPSRHVEVWIFLYTRNYSFLSNPPRKITTFTESLSAFGRGVFQSFIDELSIQVTLSIYVNTYVTIYVNDFSSFSKPFQINEKSSLLKRLLY